MPPPSLSLYVCVCLRLSLSHMHTHTHQEVNKRKCQLSVFNDSLSVKALDAWQWRKHQTLWWHTHSSAVKPPRWCLRWRYFNNGADFFLLFFHQLLFLLHHSSASREGKSFRGKRPNGLKCPAFNVENARWVVLRIIKSGSEESCYVTRDLRLQICSLYPYVMLEPDEW